MRGITKGPEPASLTAHRRRSHSDFGNYQQKDELRRALVGEQRGLCCYCMDGIKADGRDMKIEHWRYRARYPDRELDYRNLLGACRGNEGQPARFQHCDTGKADSDLERNPADPAHRIESRIQYGAMGEIRSPDATFNGQLDEVLNLNLRKLRNGRKSVLDAVLGWWNEMGSRYEGRALRQQLERQRARYDGGVADLTPYCQVAIWWLDQKLGGGSSPG